MPSSRGITIETTLLDQSTSANITQNAAITSTTAANNLQLIGLPQQHWCTATIKVSSVATPSNSASQSFTVVYK
jgi:ABC-type enterochelin transport system substrate-binding protein